MSLEALPHPSLADSYVLVVDNTGTCVLHPRVPKVEGKKLWDFSHTEDLEGLRDLMVRACMFREHVTPFLTRLMCGDNTLRVSMELFPLETGQVLVVYHRLFDGMLSCREQKVLSLAAEGVDVHQTATELGITVSTVRDHIASIKRKLNIGSKEDYLLAAQNLSLGLSQPE